MKLFLFFKIYSHLFTNMAYLPRDMIFLLQKLPKMQIIVDGEPRALLPSIENATNIPSAGSGRKVCAAQEMFWGK